MFDINTANKDDNLLITKNQLYVDQHYPQKMLFSFISQYYQKNEIKKIDQKGIVNEYNAELTKKYSDLSFQMIINHCQHQNYHVSRDNVFPLYFIAKKYNVKSLIDEINEYFSNYSNDVLVQLFLKLQDSQNFDYENEITIISSNLKDYIKDDLLLSIPITLMYTIAEKYVIQNSYSLISDHSIIEFFFKYMDKHGEKSSILFSLVDFKNNELIYFNRLITNYSKIFNFNLINTIFSKELAKKEELKKKQIKQKNEKIMNFFQSEVRQKDNQIKQIKKLLYFLFMLFSMLSFFLIFYHLFRVRRIQYKLIDLNQKFVKQINLNKELIEKCFNLENRTDTNQVQSIKECFNC